jgi:hypothetical protein
MKSQNRHFSISTSQHHHQVRPRSWQSQVYFRVCVIWAQDINDMQFLEATSTFHTVPLASL